MSELPEPRRALEDESVPADVREALRTLKQPAPTRSLQAQLAGWSKVEAAVQGPGPARWRVLAFATALAALTLVVLLRDPVREPVTLAFEPLGAATVTQHGNTWSLTAGQARVRARGDQRTLVVTPQVELVVLKGVVLVDVTQGQTVVSVEEGQAEVRRRGLTQVLEPGAPVTFRSLSAPPIPAPESVAVTSCDGAPDLEACLESVAAGAGLAAETAQFELALRAANSGNHQLAIERLIKAERNFPGGMLAAEVLITRVREEAAVGDEAAAARDARRFIELAPSDARVEALRRWLE